MWLDDEEVPSYINIEPMRENWPKESLSMLNKLNISNSVSIAKDKNFE